MLKAKGYTIIQDGRKKKYQGNGYKNSRQFHKNFYTIQEAINFTIDNKINKKN
jgi:hypothetical protein